MVKINEIENKVDEIINRQYKITDRIEKIETSREKQKYYIGVIGSVFALLALSTYSILTLVSTYWLIGTSSDIPGFVKWTLGMSVLSAITIFALSINNESKNEKIMQLKKKYEEA